MPSTKCIFIILYSLSEETKKLFKMQVLLVNSFFYQQLVPNTATNGFWSVWSPALLCSRVFFFDLYIYYPGKGTKLPPCAHLVSLGVLKKSVKNNVFFDKICYFWYVGQKQFFFVVVMHSKYNKHKKVQKKNKM